MIDFLIVTALALLGAVVVWAVRRRAPSITGYVNPDGTGRGNWHKGGPEVAPEQDEEPC